MMRPAKFRFAPGISLGSALALTLSGAALTQTLDDGVEAYRSGDYERAFTIFKENAEQGDTKAQYLLGTLYLLGQGTKRNEYSAFAWYRLAAEEGLLEAQYQVGMMYLRGEGVTSNDDEALKWIWTAADRGYPQANEMLEYVLQNDFTYGC